VTGINPEYFLDEMSISEVTAIYKAKAEYDRAGWEQTRLISFFSVVGFQGTKTIKTPHDLYRFPWDNKETKDRPFSQEAAMERLKELKLKRHG
jgi:hypothetical protein